MLITDRVNLGAMRVTGDGYLVTDARIARIGIQVYAGREVGRPDVDAVRVYRPAAEVFSQDAMASFAHRPVTNDHPSEAVSAKNWKRHSIGMTGDEVARDGAFVRVPMVLMDEAAIESVRGGKRELSCGYTCDLKFEPGVTPEGEAYDAIQTNIRGNHLAIVSAGRAGEDCRIGDGADDHQKDRNMPENLRTVMVDGLSIQTTDQGAQAIEKLQRALDDSAKALTDANTAHAAAIKAKDEQLGTLTADKKKLEDAMPKPADLDRMVAGRVALVTTARTLVADLKPEGLTDADIRKAVVKAKLGEDVLKDATDDMVTGMFKALAKDVKPSDPVRGVIQGGIQSSDAHTTVDQAHAGMVNHLTDAWKGSQQKGAA